MPGEMRLTFLVALVGMACLFVTLWKYEMAAKHAAIQLRSLKRRLAGDDGLAPLQRAPPPRSSSDARAPARRGRQVRRRRLPRLPRADPVYVAIMAVELARIERDLAELDELAEQREAERARARSERGVSELLLLGMSHKTAPLARARAPRADRARARTRSCAELRARTRTIHEAVVVSTCNRTELYLVVGDPVEAETAVLGMLARRAGMRPTELLDGVYSHAQLRRRAPPLPRRRRPGVDDRRRGRGPGPGQARLRGRARPPARPAR